MNDDDESNKGFSGQSFESLLDEYLDDIGYLPDHLQSDAELILSMTAMSDQEIYAKAQLFYTFGVQLLPQYNRDLLISEAESNAMIQLNVIVKILGICVIQYGVLNAIKGLFRYWVDMSDKSHLHKRISQLFLSILQQHALPLHVYKSQFSQTDSLNTAVQTQSALINDTLTTLLSEQFGDAPSIVDGLQSYL